MRLVRLQFDDGSPSSFIPFIQLLRGIAPLPVVWAHLGGAWYFATHGKIFPPFQWFRATFSEPLHLFQDGAHLGVVVFFLISGYIISHVGQNESLLEFLIKRSVRLLPTLFLAVFGMYVLAAVSPFFGLPALWGTQANSAFDYISTALLFNFAANMPSGLGVTWTLYAEVIFYAIFAMWIGHAKSAPILSTIGMMAVAALILAPIHFSNYAVSQTYFTACLPLFIIGRAMYLRHTGQISFRAATAFFAVNFAALFYVYSVARPEYLWQPPTEPIVTYVAAIMIFYVAMASNIKRVPRVFNFLGNISYALYLVHVPVGVFSMNVLYGAKLPLGATVLCGIAISIAAAFLVTRYVEAPARALARSYLRRRSTPAVSAGSFASL